VLVCFNPPPHLSADRTPNGAPAPEGNPLQRVCGRRRSRPTPCAQPSTTDHRSRSAADAPTARTPRGFARQGQNFAEGPQLRLALALLDAQASAVQAEWGHGVGRHARQMRGEIVSTCKKLRVRSRSRGVQSKMYRLMYPESAAFLNLQRETHVCRIYI
jgi:hypothetical protein